MSGLNQEDQSIGFVNGTVSAKKNFMYIIIKLNNKIFLDGYSTRNFQHQYPTSPFIKAQYITGTKTFYFWYKVVSLGYYPTPVKLTQKNSKDGFQYQIPDNYIIETEVSGMKIQCETKYQLNGKVRFTIAWKENRSEWSLYSDRSATSVVNTFLKVFI